MYLHFFGIKKTKSRKASAIFFIVLGISWFVPGNILLFVRMWFYENSNTTNGIIIENRPNKNKNGEIEYTPVYQYKDSEDKQYVNAEKFSSNPPMYKMNQQIEVRYSVKSPSKSMINNFNNIFLLPIIFIFGGVLFLLIGVLTGKNHWNDNIVWE